MPCAWDNLRAIEVTWDEEKESGLKPQIGDEGAFNRRSDEGRVLPRLTPAGAEEVHEDADDERQSTDRYQDLRCIHDDCASRPIDWCRRTNSRYRAGLNARSNH